MRAYPSRKNCGRALVLLGTILILIRSRPVSNFYFPCVWFGYILTLDGTLDRRPLASLWRASRRRFLLLLPISAAFWWLFEAFNVGVNSWKYVGANFPPVGYVLYASVCFSTVMLGVWETAAVVSQRFWRQDEAKDFYAPLTGKAGRGLHASIESGRSLINRRMSLIMAVSVGVGAAFIILPVLFPHYTFPLIWGAVFFILDPANYWLGRSSLIYDVVSRQFRTALTFAFAALICGFLWEAWNYWATVKWVYHVPFVSQLHLFEMPVPGYLGYLPFGLEVYAATVFTLPSTAALMKVIRRRFTGDSRVHVLAQEHTAQGNPASEVGAGVAN